MSKITIYHNPRCTKSRQTLALLKEHGIEPVVVEYLDNPPDAETITRLLKKLGLAAKDVIRRKEFRELGVALPDDDKKLIEIMAENPRIIERPIVVKGTKARLGRPPENVLELL